MIRYGYTYQTAIDKIYEIYRAEDGSVTKILRRIREDKRNGGHRELRY